MLSRSKSGATIVNTSYKYINLYLDCPGQSAICHEYSNVTSSGVRGQPISHSITMPEYTEDYNAIRMMHEPQANTFIPSNNNNLETHEFYNSATHGYRSNDELATGPNLSLLPTFPSYFVSRECKGHRSSIQNRSNSNDTLTTPLTDAARLQSNPSNILPTNYQHNL